MRSHLAKCHSCTDVLLGQRWAGSPQQQAEFYIEYVASVIPATSCQLIANEVGIIYPDSFLRT